MSRSIKHPPIIKKEPSSSSLRRHSHNRVKLSKFQLPIRRSFSEKTSSSCSSFSKSPPSCSEESENSFGYCRQSFDGTKDVAVTPTTIATCVSKVVFGLIVEGKEMLNRGHVIPARYDLFCSGGSSRGDCSVSSKGRRTIMSHQKDTMPTLNQIIQFVAKICKDTQMEYECLIILLIYIRRLIKTSEHKFILMGSNWKGVVLSCALLANKVWDDFHMQNLDYTVIFKGLTIYRVNALERLLLKCIDNSCNVSPVVFAKTHFEVQEIITRQDIKKDLRNRKKLYHPRIEPSPSDANVMEDGNADKPPTTSMDHSFSEKTSSQFSSTRLIGDISSSITQDISSGEDNSRLSQYIDGVCLNHNKRLLVRIQYSKSCSSKSPNPALRGTTQGLSKQRSRKCLNGESTEHGSANSVKAVRPHKFQRKKMKCPCFPFAVWFRHDAVDI